MKKMLGGLLAVWAMGWFGAMSLASAGNEGMPPAYTGSKEFELLKSLSGDWIGSETSSDKPVPVTANYKVTSNGSAVLETLFPGTDHEMISVYTEIAGKLSMTHYCSIGNQPKLDLVEYKNGRGIYIFELSKSEPNVNAATERHMHGLTLSYEDDEHLVQEWTSYQDGKPVDKATVFEFVRQRPAPKLPVLEKEPAPAVAAVSTADSAPAPAPVSTRSREKRSGRPK